MGITSYPINNIINKLKTNIFFDLRLNKSKFNNYMYI